MSQTSQWRRDPITGRWVIVAKCRADRPQGAFETYSALGRPLATSGARDPACPFCEGNEALTPLEILARRDAGSGRDQPGWRVRVTPNKYPALRIDGDFQKPGDGQQNVAPGFGLHEVIIETPPHLAHDADSTAEQLAEVLGVYRDRLDQLRTDRRLAYGLIFKNVGSAAGATQPHLHSQLIATPIIPPQIAAELSGAEAFFRREGACVFCRLIEQELQTGERIVLDSPRFIAFAPFAGRMPYEIWIAPKEHASHFELSSSSHLAELAQVLLEALRRLAQALGRPAYNYWIHTSPFDSAPSEHYHWHIEIIPRTTTVAGFELGAGCFINPVPPEEAAAILRQAKS